MLNNVQIRIHLAYFVLTILNLVYNRIWCDIMVYIVICCVCNHNCSCILLALCTLAYWTLCLGFWTTWHFVNIASKLYIVQLPQSWLHSMHTTVLYQHSSARIRLETIYKSSSYTDKDKNGISRAGRYSECLFHPFSCILKYHKRERVTTALSIQLLESPCPLVRSFVTKLDHIFNGRSSSSSSYGQTLLTQLGLRTYTIHLDTCITLWIHASCIHASCIQASYIHAYIRVHASELHGHICVGHTPWVPKGAKDEVKEARRAAD